MDFLILYDIGLVVLFSTMLALLAKILKQPVIPAYILSGILLGPQGLAIITNEALIVALSEIGIALLLFTVGMEMDLTKLKNVGKIASFGSLLQMILTAGGGFILATYLGFNNMLAQQGTGSADGRKMHRSELFDCLTNIIAAIALADHPL